MFTILVDRLPKSCAECNDFCVLHRAGVLRCILTDDYIDADTETRDADRCPLVSVEEVVEEIQKYSHKGIQPTMILKQDAIDIIRKYVW